ncbi:MAG TPA: AbrB/MazE/SpoVT family DNA-binding domain-containing protein [Devosia sp.]|nr:AbrB/MazE/SpoVT family DNA-binding domain-containing protein [Devosia sp.]
MSAHSKLRSLPAAKAVSITTHVKRAGGSLLVTVPAPARKALGFSEGQELAVSVEEGRLVYEAVQQRHRRKYSLEDLLAQSKAHAAVNEATRNWLDEPAKGKELW